MCPHLDKEAKHVMLVKPRPLRRRIIDDDVTLNELADPVLDSKLHSLKLECGSAAPQSGRYLFLLVAQG